MSKKLTGGILSCILICVLFFVLFVSRSNDHSNDTLYFATSVDYPPFEYRVRGELRGFEIELGRLVAMALGKQAEFLDMQFVSLLTSINSNIADIGISTITITEERKKNFDFSTQYYFEKLALLFNDTQPIKSILQLNGKKVACQIGTTMEIWTRSNIQNVEVITTDNNMQALEMLKAKHVDAVIIDYVQAVEFTKRNTKLGYQVIAQADAGYAMAFKKGSPLKYKVNQALLELEQNGELAKLRKKYLEVE